MNLSNFEVPNWLETCASIFVLWALLQRNKLSKSRIIWEKLPYWRSSTTWKRRSRQLDLTFIKTICNEKRQLSKKDISPFSERTLCSEEIFAFTLQFTLCRRNERKLVEACIIQCGCREGLMWSHAFKQWSDFSNILAKKSFSSDKTFWNEESKCGFQRKSLEDAHQKPIHTFLNAEYQPVRVSYLC